MKGERAIIESPFRYGGMSHAYSLDWEDWQKYDPIHLKKCFCCGGKGGNLYSQKGTLLKRNYPYMAVYRFTKGKYKEKCYFKIICRACAYGYGLGVVEMDGEKYYKYGDFDEYLYKKKLKGEQNHADDISD